jgi:hypothetical protein
MLFNATFNNISIISWRSVLIVEETGVSRENHWPVETHGKNNADLSYYREQVSMMLKWIYDESWQIYIYIFIAVQIWSMYSTSKMSLLENTVIWHHWDTDYWWFQICHLHIWPECTSMQYIQDLNCLYFIRVV